MIEAIAFIVMLTGFAVMSYFFYRIERDMDRQLSNLAKLNWRLEMMRNEWDPDEVIKYFGIENHELARILRGK